MGKPNPKTPIYVEVVVPVTVRTARVPTIVDERTAALDAGLGSITLGAQHVIILDSFLK